MGGALALQLLAKSFHARATVNRGPGPAALAHRPLLGSRRRLKPRREEEDGPVTAGCPSVHSLRLGRGASGGEACRVH